MESLWPDFAIVTDTSYPFELLKDQATFLSAKTKGHLFAEVFTRSCNTNDDIGSKDFNICTEFKVGLHAIEGYRIVLLKVYRAAISAYPADCCSESNCFTRKSCADANEFTDWLKGLLHSDWIRAVIGNLYAISLGNKQSGAPASKESPAYRRGPK